MKRAGTSDHVFEEQYVSRAMSEALLERVAKRSDDSRAGLFGPASTLWKVSRECGVFLAAGRAALLQLAHPWVAASLKDHSNVLGNPIGRFHNTFRVVFAMYFGTTEQALSASRHLYTLHTRIQGRMPDDVAGYRAGSSYRANESNALRWVYATLIESAIVAYESVLPPLSKAELEDYYSETKWVAALFGIAPEALPHDWTAFEQYNRRMWASDELGVNEHARAMAHRILSGAGSWIRPGLWYRSLTAAWMPDRLREEFALPFGVVEQRSAERALRWLPRVYSLLPRMLRFVGPYHEALGRLRGRTRPGPFTRANTRFWTGQPQLMPPTSEA